MIARRLFSKLDLLVHLFSLEKEFILEEKTNAMKIIQVLLMESTKKVLAHQFQLRMSYSKSDKSLEGFIYNKVWMQTIDPHIKVIG